MALQIRRGTDEQRQITRFNAGELIYTTNYKDLFVGDGTTNGGIRIAPIKSINGLDGSAATGALTLTSDNISQGSTNLYYSSTQARIDAGAALVAGNVGNTGISFTYNSGANSITAVVTAGGYSLPVATSTELGGIKISQGGLSIDGAGLVSINVPTGTGVTGHLSYYTSSSALGDAGTGLTWSTTNPIAGTGGQLTVNGIGAIRRILVNQDLTAGGLYIATENNGDGDYDMCTLYSSHALTNPSAMRMFRTRGTVASPTTVNSSDNIFDIQFAAATGATGAGIAAQIRGGVNGTVSTNVVPGKLVFSAADSSGTLVDSLTVAATKVSAAVPFQVVSYANGTARDAAITSPAAGMIVFLTDTSKFSGYNGAAWDNLN